MDFLISIPGFAAFTGLCVLLIDNLLWLDGHVHNVGSFGLESTFFSKSATVRHSSRDTMQTCGDRSEATVQPIEGFAQQLHKRRQDMVWRLPFNGTLSSSIRPKCINRIELGEVGRGSHSVETCQPTRIHGKEVQSGTLRTV